MQQHFAEIRRGTNQRDAYGENRDDQTLPPTADDRSTGGPFTVARSSKTAISVLWKICVAARNLSGYKFASAGLSSGETASISSFDPTVIDDFPSLTPGGSFQRE